MIIAGNRNRTSNQVNFLSPGQFGLFGQGEELLPDLIRVMDLLQEQLARSLGEGRRVIRRVPAAARR